jgi:hypothetical protein
MTKIAAIRIALSISFSCLLLAIAPHAHRVEAARSKQPLTMTFETGRFEPAPDCKKNSDGCFPNVFVPAREFKAGSVIWVRAISVNHSKFTACFGQNNFLVDVTENATGAKPKLVQHGDGIIMITATPPEVNFCIAPKQTGTSLFVEVTHTYVLDLPGTYSASVYVPNVGLTTTGNLSSDPFHLDFYRDENSVKYIGKVESNTGQFVIVQ